MRIHPPPYHRPTTDHQPPKVQETRPAPLLPADQHTQAGPDDAHHSTRPDSTRDDTSSDETGRPIEHGTDCRSVFLRAAPSRPDPHYVTHRNRHHPRPSQSRARAEPEPEPEPRPASESRSKPGGDREWTPAERGGTPTSPRESRPSASALSAGLTGEHPVAPKEDAGKLPAFSADASS